MLEDCDLPEDVTDILLDLLDVNISIREINIGGSSKIKDLNKIKEKLDHNVSKYEKYHLIYKFFHPSI